MKKKKIYECKSSFKKFKKRPIILTNLQENWQVKNDVQNDQFEKPNWRYHYIPHKHSKESKVLVQTTLCTWCWQLWWNGPIPQNLQSIKTLQGKTEKWPKLWKRQMFQTDKAEANRPVYCACWRDCEHEVYQDEQNFS